MAQETLDDPRTGNNALVRSSEIEEGAEPLQMMRPLVRRHVAIGQELPIATRDISWKGPH